MSNYFPSKVKDLHDSKQRVIGNVLHELEGKQRKSKFKWRYVGITAALLFSMLFFLNTVIKQPEMLVTTESFHDFKKPTIYEEQGALYVNDVTLGDSKDKVIAVFGDDYEIIQEDKEEVIVYGSEAKFYVHEDQLKKVVLRNVDRDYFNRLYKEYDGFTFFTSLSTNFDGRFIYAHETEQLIMATFLGEELTMSLSYPETFLGDKAEYLYTVEQNLRQGQNTPNGINHQQPLFSEDNGSLSLQGIALGNSPSHVIERLGDNFLIGYVDGEGSDFTLNYERQASFSFLENQLISAIYSNVDKSYFDQIFNDYEGFTFISDNENYIYSQETNDLIKATDQTPNEEYYLYLFKAGPNLMENPDFQEKINKDE